MKYAIAALMFSALIACGANQKGLKDQAASDMKCDKDELKTKQTKNGYAGDDFGALVEVTGCGDKAVYEKKGPENWALVTEPEAIEE